MSERAPESPWKIPLFDTRFDESDLEAVQAPLRDGWLAMGPRTRRLEEEFAALTGAGHAIAVTNCTAALHLALEAVGVGPGDEVIVPALTFVASANAVRYCGGRVVFADIVGPDDLNLDPEDVARRITPRTTAIVAVHYAGYPAHIERLCEIADAHGLAIVEDCAHALVTRIGDRHLGTFGAAGCFSFFTNKNLTCGEGGLITVSDGALAERLRLRRSHGMTTLTVDRHAGRAWSYDCVETGWNVRIDEIRASLASSQLARLPERLERRRGLRAWYVEALEPLPVGVPFRDWDRRPDVRVGSHIMPVVLPAGVDRQAVMRGLKDDGIQSSIHYPPAHRFTAARDEGHGPLPVTDEIAERQLTLPFYPEMTREDVATVCASLERALATASGRAPAS